MRSIRNTGPAASRPSISVQDRTTNPWLHRFAVLTAIATLGLLCVGGLVTSHGVGMAVPDWPNTNGYNMFFFPFSKWVGGIFYEHSHRLVASGVGLLTTILALWLYGTKAQRLLRWVGCCLVIVGGVTRLAAPVHAADAVFAAVVGLAAFGASWVWPRCEPAPRWLRRLGLVAFLAVVLQGVLGGLRVVLLKDQIGIFHATLAQLFFVLSCALALFTSSWWQSRARNRTLDKAPDRSRAAGSLAWLFTVATGLILSQLVLGATMRHQHAGLAIPDFPLAYGKLWPAMDPAAIVRYNQQRLEITALNDITAFQVGLQMVHRLMAALIIAAVTACAWLAQRRLGRHHALPALCWTWLGLILLQALLGAATIWSNKAADIATAHVLVGALSLALGAMLSIISWQNRVWARSKPPVPSVSTVMSFPPSPPQPASLPAGSRA
jgi:cytochrome c oxidase assembly protein subunit 15